MTHRTLSSNQKYVQLEEKKINEYDQMFSKFYEKINPQIQDTQKNLRINPKKTIENHIKFKLLDF